MGEQIDLGTDQVQLEVTRRSGGGHDASTGRAECLLTQHGSRALGRLPLVRRTRPGARGGADRSGPSVLRRGRSACRCGHLRRTGRRFSAQPVDPPAWAVRKPVLAAINGHAIGIGLTLALQCDLRYVAVDAKLAIPQVRFGVLPDAGAHWTLRRVTSTAVAADLLLTGRTVSADEAGRLGLVVRGATVRPGAAEGRAGCSRDGRALRAAVRRRDQTAVVAGSPARRDGEGGDRVSPGPDGRDLIPGGPAGLAAAASPGLGRIGERRLASGAG